YRYSAYGEITFGAPQYENEYTYNGESYNPNIESQYLRTRYYYVVTGSFLTEDSYLGEIKEPLTLKRYAYCVASPLNYWDPSGYVKTATIIQRNNRVGHLVQRDYTPKVIRPNDNTTQSILNENTLSSMIARNKGNSSATIDRILPDKIESARNKKQITTCNMLNLSELYVNLDQLDAFEFFLGLTDIERQDNIIKLNQVLEAYDITSALRIAFFMGQVKHESRAGARTLESFSGNFPEEYFNGKYSDVSILGNLGGNDGEHFRGAGYLQLTGRYNYQRFADYVGDQEIMVQGYQIVGGVYNQPVENIKKEDKGVIDIGKYAWEASGWYWNYGSEGMAI
ncbi:hypothetical protein LJC58_07850, partial [Lachnospiraceae bacterium OttesenSCG-928-D06]|nr:hypothetical protein [Lachnospiraceae bacterium OttesenSCG-928-D06]